ncbi:MAG: aminodeoxychorismate/anthranilate synthase component II [Verrucomicrobia bacterium]|nr:aminodeoxychorismate/anthranilate synthase component II [Verrucomicrobiota bacterium]
MILLIDNYDSFTYNLFQAIAVIRSDVKVVRNDQITIEEIEKLGPEAIILSPGPGRPEDSGVCLDVIKKFGPKIPILGVCLGHQAIGLVYGGRVIGSSEIRHGKESLIFHRRKDLFRGMPLPFQAGRYHSLLIEKESLPEELIIEAETPEGLIMAVSHKTHPVYGVQFHPESILTPEGMILIRNFIERASCFKRT